MREYDVIVAGGGLGGLTAGVILAKEGMNVCVIEQHSIVGGCLQSFRRGDHILDTGMHYVGSLDKGQTMHQYFKYMGIVDRLNLQKLDEEGFDYFHFNDGSTFRHAMGYERFIDTLAAEYPDERENIKNVCRLINRVGRTISPDVLRRGKISDGGIDYMSVSAFDKIASNVKCERLQHAMAGNCKLYAGNKLTTSLYEYGMITHSNIEGAYAFTDGSQQIADLLAEQIKTHGGEVRLNAKLAKIHLNGNSVEWVELASGERLRGKWVVSSLHPTQTFALLENNSVYKRAFFTRINSLEDTYGLFTTYLVMKPKSVRYVNQNHYLFNSTDAWSTTADYKGHNIASTLLCMQPNANSKYTNVVTLLTPMSLSQCQRWADSRLGQRSNEYNEFKQSFSEAVIDFVGQYYPTLRGSIDRIYTATPLTYRDYTSTPDGSAYGIIKDCRNPLVTLIPTRTRIANLLLAGQSVNIHGCLGTTITSAVACGEIVGTEYLAKKIGNA